MNYFSVIFSILIKVELFKHFLCCPFLLSHLWYYGLGRFLVKMKAGNATFLFLVNKPKSPPKLKPAKLMFSKQKKWSAHQRNTSRRRTCVSLGRWACVISEKSQTHSKNAPDRVWANSERQSMKNTARHFMTEYG